MMALNPGLRALHEMVANSPARHRPVSLPVELGVPYLVAGLAELGLQKATKKELLRVMKVALERETLKASVCAELDAELMAATQHTA